MSIGRVSAGEERRCCLVSGYCPKHEQDDTAGDLGSVETDLGHLGHHGERVRQSAMESVLPAQGVDVCLHRSAGYNVRDNAGAKADTVPLLPV